MKIRQLWTICLIALGTTVWGETNLPPALPLPVSTNLLPTAMSVTSTQMVTNVVTRIEAVDTPRLAKAMEGTDAVTKQKVATAIQAIRAGNDGIAIEQLRGVKAQTALSDSQVDAINLALDQLITTRKSD